MKCQRCDIGNVVSIFAHHSDCFNIIHRDTNKEINGYAPKIEGICGGDDTHIDLCLNCGQIQGKFPKEVPEELLQNSEEE